MKIKTILLIGGPSSGKTTLLNNLKNLGYTCYPEISREVTKEAQKKGIDQLFIENPMLFSTLLLEGRIKQFTDAHKEEGMVFIDRGIPDVLAYMDFIGDTYPEKFVDACKNYKYDMVVMLPPWKEIYQTDGERYETYEQALEIHDNLVKTYQKYGYNIIELPKVSVNERTKIILEYIA
jgi:predicted ATPase